MKTILFVPTYWHSSIELFSNIIKRLDGNIKKVLLETDDPHYKNFIDRKSIKDTVDIYFDQMVFLRFPSTLKKTIKSIPKILRYQRHFKKVFEIHKPDLIITTGDRNNFYTLLQHYKCDDVPILLFQTSLVSVRYYLEGKACNNLKSYLIEKKSSFSNINNGQVYDIINRTIEFFLKILKKGYHATFRVKPFLSVEYAKGWGLHDPKNILVIWGPISEQLFSRYRKNTYCLGNPLIDDLYNFSFNHKKEPDLYAQLGIDSTQKTILVSAPCLADIRKKSELFFWYESIIKEFDQLNFLIKLHPRDDINSFLFLVKFNNLKIVKSEYTFKTLLRISDLSLSHYSATSIDAVASGISAILLPITALSKDDQDYWFSSSIFIKPKTVSACIDSIKKWLKNSNQKRENEKGRIEYLHDMFSENIGHSTEKIIGKINELLKRRQEFDYLEKAD